MGLKNMYELLITTINYTSAHVLVRVGKMVVGLDCLEYRGNRHNS